MNGSIQSLLLASDFSTDATHAAHRAALLAGEHGAKLKLLNIVREDLLTDLRRRLGGQSEAAQRLIEGAKLDLDTLAVQLQPRAGSGIECLVRTGDVLDEILTAADHADVLVLGAHGLHPTQDLLLGTTAERLLRKSRRPMLIIRTEARTAYQRVFVAVDFSVHSFAAFRFAHQIAPAARLHLFHAYECPYEGKLRQANLPEETIGQLRAQFRDQALANMQNMIGKTTAPLERTSSAVAFGNARFTTSTAAADWGADLIVLGKHGYSLIGEYFLGGVTRHTVSRAKCDVAVVPEWPRL